MDVDSIRHVETRRQTRAASQVFYNSGKAKELKMYHYGGMNSVIKQENDRRAGAKSQMKGRRPKKLKP